MNEDLKDLFEETCSFCWPEPTFDALHCWLWPEDHFLDDDESFDEWLHSMEDTI